MKNNLIKQTKRGMAITKGVADSKGGMRHLVAPAAAQMKNVKGGGMIKIKISKILNRNWLLVKCKLMGKGISQAGRQARRQSGRKAGIAVWSQLHAGLILVTGFGAAWQPNWQRAAHKGLAISGWP